MSLTKSQKETLELSADEQKRHMDLVQGFHIGQVWKTRGGWEARIVAIIRSKKPIVAVHTIPFWNMEECAEEHFSDGSSFQSTDGSSYDLFELVRSEA